ncbi:MAG: CPXCG motif-containing cysteine-rich protein [Xanthomarina gelatinilytica]|uniref:CPXCG motif-containing cysteine-rich protein n=1 Tax=Xanthomarina gelatinilytica TaxID=1137281 RepID=UPI003A89BAF6
MQEYFFKCPYCWETLSMLLDTSQSQQDYVEDCEVCCNPIQISLKFHDTELMEYHAKKV